jgi:glycerol uptake facilitator-like aquaporin
MHSIAKRSVAEFIGTAILVCTVVGSGIMGTNLSDDLAVALLVNALATVAVLALLIQLFAPISGAHFNPAVSLAMAFTKRQKLADTVIYVMAQISGAIAGAITANLMFNLAAVQFSQNVRFSPGTFLGEVIATAGLITVIYVLIERNQEKLIPVAVAGWIGTAYFFTSSTSFANPAVTIGRVFTDTFSGIAADSVLPFIAAQLIGAAIGVLFSKTVLSNKTR